MRDRDHRHPAFEPVVFSPAPIPVVAPNELDLPEDN